MSHQYKNEARLLRNLAVFLILLFIIFNQLLNHWDDISLYLNGG